MIERRLAVDSRQADAAARLRWPVEALWAQLETLRPGLNVEVAVELDSTSTRLLDRARAGDTAPCLLVAERQTAGRGRLGRPWFSADGQPGGPAGPASLTFSIGLVLAPADWSGLSLAVGVVLAESLQAGVQLKWPNDLWLVDAAGQGRKLGGVLIETQPLPAGDAQAGSGARYAVIGVGINLEPPAPRPELTMPVAGWREIEPQVRAPELLARLAPPLLGALGRFERDGFAAFAQRFAARDALAGRLVATADAQPVTGRADGVDARGALRLQTDAGLRLVSSSEVSVRPC